MNCRKDDIFAVGGSQLNKSVPNFSEICEKADLVLEFTVVAYEGGKQRRRSRASRRRPGTPGARRRPRSVRATEVQTSVELDEALTEKLRRICTRAGRGGHQVPAKPKKLNP